MCGIAGIFRWDSRPVETETLRKMAGALHPRGPDDEGFYTSDAKDGTVRAGLGFRRLSIIDLSGGHQPMSVEGGRYWIVFNGEIYNFPELKKELEARGVKFETRSDTEVLLQLYAIHGEQCVYHLRGMFAFAIFDSVKRSLFLARDRIGKKPLFYAKAGDAFYFASEMKALLQVQEIPRRIRKEAIPLYLAYQFIPGPMTIFEGIERVPPAHTLTVSEHGEIRIEKYWNISRIPDKKRNIDDTCEELRHVLREATKIRMISDVPLGAFLSGGIDSSAVVGFMAEASKEPVKTFSIGFEESGFSELKYARVIAEKFKTDHHEFIVKPQMADLLPKLAYNYDQPFADPSALPSYYVANETRKHVTVALNGDGGDESFGGYLRYQADKIFGMVAAIPAPLRSAASSVIARMPATFRMSRIARRIMRAGSVLGSDPHEFNFKLFCYFDQEEENALFDEPLLSVNRDRNVLDYFLALYDHSDSEEFLDQVFACDAYGYLPDCLLVKMDIASMSNSLEARSPFLDHKVMEFAARIPAKYKVKWNGGKWILKRALRGFIPDEILFRRKMGFGIPLAEWFRGPLKSFLRDHVLSAQARQRGYFKMQEVERLVNEHQNGARDHGYKLWALLMLELWHESYIDGQRP